MVVTKAGVLSPESPGGECGAEFRTAVQLQSQLSAPASYLRQRNT